MSKRLSFAGPSITELEINNGIDAIKNGWYQNWHGYIDKLEDHFKQKYEMKYAKATFCATMALELACIVLKLKKGDEVIVPDFSWMATVSCILHTGATPVFVDIDSETWCINPKKIEEAITENTKAIMVVHTYGMPAKMHDIINIAKKYNLKIIEDAAPALGSTYCGEQVGTLGDIGVFSFHGAKIAVSGEGGIFLTNDDKYGSDAMLYGGMGRTDQLDGRYVNFACSVLGHEFCISNIQAALAFSQASRIDELVTIKRNIFRIYNERLGTSEKVQLIKEPDYAYSNYCYPGLLLKTDVSRQNIIDKLKEKNIHTRATFPRMSQMPPCRIGRTYDNGVAELVSQKGLNLPSAANLTTKDIHFVCDNLLELL